LAKPTKRKCPKCGEIKEFRADQKTCGCGNQERVLAETNEIKGDTWEISLPKTRIKTLEQLIEHCKIDTTIWEIQRWICNKWEVGTKNENTDKVSVEPLFQIKAWLVRKSVAVSTELADLKADAKKHAKIFTAKKYKPSENNMLEICIPDLHFGKLAWAPETGYENYDLKIAAECFGLALDALVDRTKQHTYEKVCFVVGNDLLHSDNPQGTTTKGTHVSCDGRFQKTFGLVRRLMCESIERLTDIAPVNVVMVPGNHDQQTVWHLGDSLECYFHKAPNVTIDNTPRLRKYVQFGRVMLMFTHGDKGKRADYPLVMATEQPEMFGATCWREAHTGHLHHARLNELHGVRVRILPALCASDDWHSENQYVGNIRSAEAYIWNGQEGLIGTAIYALPVDSDNRVSGHKK
jgi:hypothetical protein